MILSNPLKVNILQSMENPFDFDLYCSKNAEAGLKVTGTDLEFAQKVGMLQYAKFKYPDASPFEAYMMLVSSTPVFVGTPASNSFEPQLAVPSGCTTCGGGQVR